MKSILMGALLVFCLVGFGQNTENISPDSIPKKGHSPRKAALFSAVIPGMGQAYNRKYWKVPIVYAAGVGMFYLFDSNNKNYFLYYNAIVDLNDGKELPSDLQQYSKDDLGRIRDYYRRNRDLSFMGLAGVYFLNIIDAMVDGYFFEYDMSDDLSLKIRPVFIQHEMYAGAMQPGTIGVQLKFKF